MKIDAVTPGPKAPDEINVIIEIPAQSGPVKYEVDKETGALFVDRFMTTAMFYPCNYGYVPGTLSEDGDPVDVLVITPVPLVSGAVIVSRPIGVLHMQDEAGIDAKILAVPRSKICPMYDNLHSPEDVCPHLLATIKHFFEHYKDLEAGKWVKVSGWSGIDAAKQEIVNSLARYKEKV